MVSFKTTSGLALLPIFFLSPGCGRGTYSRAVDRQFHYAAVRIQIFCSEKKRLHLSPAEIEAALYGEAVEDLSYTNFRVTQIKDPKWGLFEFRSPGADQIFMSEDDYVRVFNAKLIDEYSHEECPNSSTDR